MIRNIVHIIPIGGAIAIAYLNISGLYLGASFSNNLALQFTAKLHEVLMIASLSEIVLYLIRSELISKHGLPFGALISGFRISQINYLWSLELWGMLTAPGFVWWRKFRFLIVIVSCITLSTSVGPSSAIGMIPRLE